MFRVGQKVVCVAEAGAAQEARYPAQTFIRLGQVYTVRGFVVGSDSEPRALLFEIVNAPMPSTVGLVEWGFPLWALRPVVERKTDISVFTKLLTPTPARTKELCDNG